MRSIPVLLLLTFLFVAASPVSDEVRLRYFRVEKEEGVLVLKWKAEIEPALHEYELYRRTQYSDGQFKLVKAVRPHGVEKEYQLRDDQVYKAASSDLVDYRIVARYADGKRTTLSTQSINYTATSIRRTWGSIKAMFQ